METANHRNRSLLARSLALFSVALYIMVSAHSPLAVYANAAHDDALFWKHAQAIVSGYWLGGYSQYTLMKGIGYPLFLAFNHVFGLPLSISHALLYCAACGLLAVAIRRLSGSAWIGLALFLLMLWHPSVLSWSRAMRDNISAAQVLLVFGCILHAYYLPGSRRRGLFFAACAGLAWAWFWLTREDGIWLLPGVGLLLLGALYRGRPQFRPVVEKTAMLVVVSLCALSLIAAVNARKYGRFELTDFKSSPYERAIAALQSVRVGDPVPYVPVPEEVRKAVYVVSPSFAELEPYLEQTGRGWTHFGCSVYPSTCGDYAGGWFVWALRDAVASVGGYESAAKAAGLYGRIGEEVRDACRSGRLTCERSLVGLMPPTTREQWRTLPDSIRKAVAMLTLRTDPPSIGPNSGPESDQDAMWQFIGRPQSWLDAGDIRLRAAGWFYSPSGTWLQLRCANGSRESVELLREDSPDIATHFNDPGADKQRFSFSSFTKDNCALETVSGPGGEATVALNDLAAATLGMRFADGELYFDLIEKKRSAQLRTYESMQKIKQLVWRTYRIGLPVLVAGGMLAFLWVVVVSFRRRRLAALPMVAIAAWCMVACRIAILVLVDISAFPAIQVHYMQPAFPLLVLAAVVSLAAVFSGDDPVFVRRASRPAG